MMSPQKIANLKMIKHFKETVFIALLPLFCQAQDVNGRIDNVQEAENALCGSLAKQAVLVASGAAKGLTYEEAVKQSGPDVSMIRQSASVFQTAYHGMAGAPDLEVRMQSYKICSENAKERANKLR